MIGNHMQTLTIQTKSLDGLPRIGHSSFSDFREGLYVSSGPMSWQVPPPTIAYGVNHLTEGSQKRLEGPRQSGHPEMMYLSLKNALIVDSGTVITENCDVFPETIPHHHQPLSLGEEWSIEKINTFQATKEIPCPTELPGRSLFLPVSSPSMSHFMFEGLVHLVDDWNKVDTIIMPVTPQQGFADIIRADTTFQPEVLFRSPDTWGTPLRCEELIIPAYRFALHPQFDRSIKNIRKALPLDNKWNPFIYISRQDTSRYRILLNESEVVELVKSYGFDVLELNNMQEIEIIERFYSAKCIIGPMGAGLYNSIFSNPGTMVIALTTANYLRTFLMHCVATTGLNFGYVFGPDFLSYEEEQHGGHNDFVVDINLVEQAILDYIASTST